MISTNTHGFGETRGAVQPRNVDGFASSHPNFPQLSGFTSSPTTHAIIFHDGQLSSGSKTSTVDPQSDLIPLQHFLDLYRRSSVMTFDIHNSCVRPSCPSFSACLFYVELHEARGVQGIKLNPVVELTH
jgi:hypothetical protein